MDHHYHRGNVSTYAEGQVGVVYLCSTLERVRALGLPWVATDRNAVLRLAKFTDDQNDLADLIDWDIMRVRYWSDSQDDKERRQAELLVHRRVPGRPSSSSGHARRRICRGSGRRSLRWK